MGYQSIVNHQTFNFKDLKTLLAKASPERSADSLAGIAAENEITRAAARFSTRLQPNHPTDNPKAILASTLDGLMLGNGDAVIGINPATESADNVLSLLTMLDKLRMRFDIPMQSCVLTHVTTTLELIKQNAPVDLVFQSIAGSELANNSFGINLNLLQEAYSAALELKRGTIGNNVMYFETGQGSALSCNRVLSKLQLVNSWL